MKDIKEIIKEHIQKNKETSIYYDYDNGCIEINGRKYMTGQLSFSEVGRAVKEALREVYGDYRTIPYTFNSEAYENEKFKAEVLALGFEGILRFSVLRKEK
ncbi:hypothetical protein DRP04_10105 [Archaeoglobales archaeon]|nr:MAG: hypothetical protein DRP04_10105 [Archaeoglobales archaeon]